MHRAASHVSMIVLLSAGRSLAAEAERFDVVVYGGTSSGVVAALQVKRMGNSVLLVSPDKHLGGLTAGGLGATDIGNKGAIGGIARDFYRAVGKHYSQPGAWRHENQSAYRSSRKQAAEDEMWTFEPHVAEMMFDRWVQKRGLPIVRDRLLERGGVAIQKGRIQQIRTEGGRTIAAEVFIDATYEGDLTAFAGVTYFVGRESCAQHGETLNGVQTANATHHQFIKPVDPYVVPGDPDSGLLLGVHDGGPGAEQAGDHRVQAYNLRLCTTGAPANRRDWPKPVDYVAKNYELLLRNFEAGDHRIPWNPIFMPNRKTDTNNNFAFSTDAIGLSDDYPEADYRARAHIVKAHYDYTQGLMWTLANSPRVPEKVRKEFQTLGLAKDEFIDNDNWPHQLYVREARRMISDYVMTQHNCQGRVTAEDSVGLAAYGMDSHNTQRYVKDGKAINEGDVQVHGFTPYPIAMRSLVPREKECTNLVVPVCLSATHIAYGSIRMEPVFMVLGQSAATIAVHAIEEKLPVQRIDYKRLRDRLVADKQVLDWTGPKPAAINPASIPGFVDDARAEKTGDWQASSAIAGFIGPGYIHDGNVGKGEKSLRFMLEATKAGKHEVRLAYTASSNRATNVPVALTAAGTTKKVLVNQRRTPPIDKRFVSLGQVMLKSAEHVSVVITTEDTDGHVVVDGVQLVPIE